MSPATPPTQADAQSRTKSLYALQWNRFRIVRPEEDRATFFGRTGLEPAELAGQRILDAGCGMGRYLRVAAEAGGCVVGIDLSDAVIAAAETVGAFPQSSVVKGDLLRPPFAPASFDMVYSIGVLDHTPDPRLAFLEIARLVKPGGRIAVWVYRKERRALEILIDLHRSVSRFLPAPALLRLSRIAAPIGGIKRRLMHSGNRIANRLGLLLNLLTLGVSMHPDPEVRVCDTLDWYGPRYMSRHTLEEVLSWFHDAGLTDVADLSGVSPLFHEGQGNGINVRGARPG